jgi:hypothetical protein
MSNTGFLHYALAVITKFSWLLPFDVVEYERRGEKGIVSCNKNILDLTLLPSLYFFVQILRRLGVYIIVGSVLYFARTQGRVLCYFSPYHICFQLVLSFEFVTTKIFSSVPLADAIRSGSNQGFMTYVPAGLFIYERINNVNLFSERIS